MLVTTRRPGARVGASLDLIGIAVRRPERARPDVPVDPALHRRRHTLVAAPTSSSRSSAASTRLASHPHCDEARRLGRHRNKALLAEDGPTLYAAAADAGVDLYYEAAVAGPPYRRPMRESLVGDASTGIGIVNGTTNYVLDRWTPRGAGFDETVEQAQALGYAEADPTADVEGSTPPPKPPPGSLAFHTRVSSAQVHREGNRGHCRRHEAAREMDAVVKLLAICELLRDESGVPNGVSVRVHPTMIKRSHPLASVRDAYNAVFVEASAAGELMFYGKGAGGDPTSSAVLGDVVAVARHRLAGGHGPVESAYADLPVVPMGDAITRYHISLAVADRPGVLAAVATVFADHDSPSDRAPASPARRTASVPGSSCHHRAPDRRSRRQ